MTGLVRGCGRRQKGAAYLEVAMSPDGQPIEEFLLDPPIPIDKDALGLSNIGVKLIQRGTTGIWDVWDIIGQQHYLNVSDFVEEARRFGISRRLSTKLDFSLLTEQSRLMLLHSRAWIDNHYDYTVAPAGLGQCPKRLPSHDPWNDNATSVMCVGLWNEDIEGGKQCERGIHPIGSIVAVEQLKEREGQEHRYVERTMPAFKYSGYRRPDGVTPVYKLALFAAFPIGRLVVIRDDDGDYHKAHEKALKAKVKVDVEDE